MQPPPRPRVRVLPLAREALGASDLTRAGRVKVLASWYGDLPEAAADSREERVGGHEGRFRYSHVFRDGGRARVAVAVCSDEHWPEEVAVLDVFVVGG